MRSCSTPWPTTSIDTGDYEFTHELVDIETLNRRAFQAELELTAVSIHAYAFLHDKYVLCTCGASMGDGYGPMVVAREPMTLDELRRHDDRRARQADERLSGAAAVPWRGFRLRRSAIRPDHSGRRRRRIRRPADRRRADHSRRAAHVRRPEAAADRRSGRLVEGADRLAAAAGRERRAQESWAPKRSAKSSGC